MTFKEAINVCVKQKFATFSGRASRSEYWWFLLAVSLGALVLALPGFLIMMASNNQEPSILAIVFFGLAALFYLAMIVPMLAVSWRRFHDRNLSGWWYLAAIIVGMIPFIGFLASIAALIVTVLKGTDGPNKFGDDPLATGKAHVFE